MRPIDFPESNIVFGKPNSMTDEQCFSISAYKGTNADGIPVINTVWMPSFEDIKAINEGRPIILSICGEGMPPVSLFTNNENGEGNF